jgi:hypothetical protein
MIVPKPEFGEVVSLFPTDTFENDVKTRIWAGLEPNAGGEMVAMIDAAGTEDRRVKMLHSPLSGLPA